MRYSLFIAFLFLAGCTLGPDFLTPDTETPDHWSDATSQIDTSNLQDLQTWWKGFNDPLLTQLVEQAITGNLDLKMAEERVIQARSERKIAASSYYPTLGASGIAARAHLSKTQSIPFGGTFNIFDIGFDSSWELDIFGETTRAVEAADATVDAAIEDRRSIMVSLLAELGIDYASLRESQTRLAIAQRNITAENDILHLTQERFTYGLSTELDVAQARAQLETIQAQIPQLQANIATRSHAIAILLGQVPESLEAELATPAPSLKSTPVLPAELPSDVIRNRPDIRMAERKLAAATAEIGVARAEQFPKFSISPFAALSSSKLHSVLDTNSLMWALPLQASQPIFEGGKLEAQVEQANSVAREDELAYRKTVITAFKDVEDALVSYTSELQRQKALSDAAAANHLALERSTEVYRGGLIDFLTVLDSERNLYASEDALAQSDFTVTQQTIALYKALGAGWQTFDPDPESSLPPR